MSSTYLKFLSRNKLYTFIEVFGLSVALGFVLFSAMGHPFQQLAEMILRSSVTSGSSLV